MGRERGSVLDCLEMMEHNLAPHKAALMMGAGLTVEDLQQRFDLVRDEVRTVTKQIEKIKAAATEGGHQNILDILEEEVEFGHGFVNSG